MKGPAAKATSDSGSLACSIGKPNPSRLAMIGCTIHSARQPQTNRGARLKRSAFSAIAEARARRRASEDTLTSASRNTTQGVVTEDMARAQAQFFPTQR